ncbi:hypothetical protein BDZ90DRAFT_231971 [Jaminaea rosea]|uniref:Uncharacterized protein n=1 Tax=Jaminaea rosea TaxID=1569628 RepID=A0A316USC7_9BASI|nr:hypothetical protein BDZ90DRAFT_231971 [Jaminaea rosea]PWN28220.1 hypothetical protein BDZ90DRAFT_231971 [Jaminaea rosea]
MRRARESVAHAIAREVGVAALLPLSQPGTRRTRADESFIRAPLSNDSSEPSLPTWTHQHTSDIQSTLLLTRRTKGPTMTESKPKVMPNLVFEDQSDTTYRVKIPSASCAEAITRLLTRLEKQKAIGPFSVHPEKYEVVVTPVKGGATDGEIMSQIANTGADILGMSSSMTIRDLNQD